MSSFSDKTTQIAVYDRAYVAQQGVSTIATTSTKFGVTAKDIICMHLLAQLPVTQTDLFSP